MFKGGKGRIERTTHYSCSAVVGQVIINRETRVQTQLDHQSGTRNKVLLGVHKKSSLQLRCSQPWASDAEAQGLNLTSSILNCGNGLELAYNRGSSILLLVPCTTLECKQVLVSYQEYECGLLFSKSVKIDSAFRKQHLPFAHLHFLSIIVFPREIEDNVYTKCLGDKQGVLREMCK